MEQIRKFIQDLILQKAHYKQLLRDMAESLSEEQIDELLDQINEIEQLIEKLKKGLE
ncbi:hypothetical protein [Emticicia soli]|uniref:Uncharacterized protein n=1 Tax=Emticicia soli TaxID=2027878 RepID=A0ABW5JE43_9BACT